jgi:hypothetical protein
MGKKEPKLEMPEKPLVTEQRLPWERMPGETSKQFYAFTVYRDMGVNRSLVKVRDKLDKEPGYEKLLGRWSSANKWVWRCQEWDSYQDDEMLARVEAHRHKMADKHNTYIDTILNVLGERLNQIIDDREWRNLSPAETIKMTELMIKLNRLENGLPTENVRQETHGTMKVANLNINIDKFTNDPEMQKLICAYLEKVEADNQDIEE